jgi:hypothetical protein
VRQALKWTALAGLAAGTALFGWNTMAASWQATISPDIFAQILVKFFNTGSAAALTLLTDRWIAPSIASYVDDKQKNGVSLFVQEWQQGAHQPRVKLALMYYIGVFGSLAIAFNL